MKKSDLYEIAIKVLGIYLIVVLINQLKELSAYATILTQQLSNQDSLNPINPLSLLAVMTISFLLLSLFTGLLIFRTKEITKLVCKKEDYEHSIIQLTDKRVIYEIALVLGGLIMISLALPEFALQLKIYFQQQNYSPSSNSLDTSFLFICGIKISLGFLFIRFSTTISNYFAKS